MGIVLSGNVQINWESINTEKRCKCELSHHCRERQQGCANDTRPDIGQDNRQKCPPPAAPQAVCCLCEDSCVDCTQAVIDWARSEEHTSELQSHLNLVCRLLLEKKKKSNGDKALDGCERYA